MKNFILGVLLTLIMVLIGILLKDSIYKHEETLRVEDILVSELKSVQKLVTVETQLSQMITYKDVKSYYFDWFSSEKNALIWVEALAQLQYDLSKLTYEINSEDKSIVVTFIPKPSIVIQPNINYYDLEQGIFNPFTAQDHNKIYKQITEQLTQKVKSSSFYKQHTESFIERLEQIQLLSSKLGWKFIYKYESSKVLKRKMIR